ncbi:MAG: signal peptidase II [Amaricoccus sp.]
MRGNRSLGLALAVATLVFLLDRLSKVWVVEQLGLRDLGRIEVLDPWFNLTMAWNPGINFGLFGTGPAGRWLLVALALAIVAGLLVWVRRGGGAARAIGVGAIVGGALGNVWDRVTYGMVADFLNFSCCGIRNPFAFNLADAAIFGGAVLLLVTQRDSAADSASRNRR